MTNILQTEFFRLKKSKLFWVMFGVCAGLPLLSALINVFFVTFLGSMADAEVSVNMWEAIGMSGITGASLSELTSLMGNTSLLAVICTSIFLSKDFSYGTFRNTLLANKSRLKLYLSHLIMAVTMGACMLGASFVSVLIFNGAIFGFGSLSFAEVVTACITTLAMGLLSIILVQTMMCMFLFGTRKLAVALACPIAICMFAPAFLVVFIDMYDILKIFATGQLTSTDLSWIPLYNTALLDVTNVDGALIGKILLYNVPLSVFFAFMGWVTFRKADLK